MMVHDTIDQESEKARLNSNSLSILLLYSKTPTRYAWKAGKQAAPLVPCRFRIQQREI